MNSQPCNKLGRIVCRLNRLPPFWRVKVLSLTFGRIIKFAGTAGIRIDQLSFSNSVLTLKNRSKVQNHIGSVHAAATALLAESASGFLVGMHIPDDKIPLLKSMEIDYIKRSQGDLQAVASLTQEQIISMRSDAKGDVLVDVKVTDSAGNQPVNCRLNWAWVPKQR